MSFRIVSGVVAIAVPFALSACATLGSSSPSASPASPAAANGSNCNPAPAQSAIGRVASASLVEEARQKSGALMARVLRPDQAVTMEFNAQRLNLSVDGTGKVIRANCG